MEMIGSSATEPQSSSEKWLILLHQCCTSSGSFLTMFVCVGYREDPKTGLPTLCRFAAEVRCSSFNQPIDVVEAWFVAFRNYWRILEENAIFIRSEPGESKFLLGG